MNNNFEQQKEENQIDFDYDLAEKLAIKRILLESSDDKLAKSELKNQIKNVFGKETEPTRKIFDLEVERQKLIIDENNKIKALENNETIEWFSGTPASFDKSSNSFIIQENGQKHNVSFGDLISDINWNKTYKLDNDCPIELKKQYYQILVDNKLFDLFNQQLLIEKTEVNKSHNSAIDQAYLATRESLEKKTESAGLLFEKMARGLLEKIAIDLNKFGLKVERANIVEDVEQKIDFIIELPEKYRGVGITEINDKKIGIQFTIKAKNSDDFSIKERQVKNAKQKNKKLDDLVLISISTGNEKIISKYHDWQKLGQPAGGPEKLFSAEDKINFVLEILKQTDLAENQEFKKDLEKYFRG